jgi:protein O-mannosyl-transferase
MSPGLPVSQSPPLSAPHLVTLSPRHLVTLGLLLLAMVVVYGRVCGYGFLTWDDPQHVLENPRVNPPGLQGLVQAWREPYWGLYIPLSYTLMAAEAAVAGRAAADGSGYVLNPAVFHVVNLTLHIVCVWLVFLILARLLALCTYHPPRDVNKDHHAERDEYIKTRRLYAACAGALLFGLHPLQVETVAWISEVRGLLCGVLVLLAVWEYLNYAEAAALHYTFATAAFLLALLSKPAAIALPLLLAVLEIGILRRNWRQWLAALVPWCAIAAVFVLVTKRLQPDSFLPSVPPLWARPLVAADSIMFYLGRLIAPFWLGPDYGRTQQWVMSQGWPHLVWPSVAIFLTLGILTFFAFRISRPALGATGSASVCGPKGTGKASGTLAPSALLPPSRVLLTAFGLFIAWLVPVLGLVPFDFQRVSSVADRYVYLAMIGPALALAWLVNRFWSRAAGDCPDFRVPTGRRREAMVGGGTKMGLSPWHARTGRAAAGVAASALAACAALSFVQTSYWRDSRTLFTHGLEVNPHSVVAPWHLGLLCAEEGKYDEAAAFFRRDLAEHPGFVEIHLELARALVDLHKPNEALQVLRDAEKFDSADVQQNLGMILDRQGSTAEAARHYRRALELRPSLPVPHYNLGNICLREAEKKPGKLEEAAEHYEAALLLKPDYAEAHVNLGAVRLMQGRRQEAIASLEAALRLLPANDRRAERVRQLLVAGGQLRRGQ